MAHDNEIDRLLLAVTNGWATPDEKEELDASLRSDAKLREYAVEWLFDESAIHSESALLGMMRGNSSEGDFLNLRHGDRVTVGPNTSRVGWLPAAMVAALACSILLNFWLSLPRGASEPAAVGPISTNGARLVKATGCLWGSFGESTKPRPGRWLAGGEALHLLQGIAELEFNGKGSSGRVRLQGPVSALLRSDGLPVLQSGRLVADVNVYGEAVWLDTPLGPVEISDHASIGVQATTDRVSVHVLDGAIRTHDRDYGSHLEQAHESSINRPPMLSFKEGEAVILRRSLGDEASCERSAADPELFAEEQSMATDLLDLGRSYSRLVSRDKPVGYWSFEDPVENGFYENRGEGDIALRIVGSASRIRQGGNHALEFGMTRDSGYLVSEGLWPESPLDSYALECWFKPSHFHSGCLFSLVNPRFTTAQRDINAFLVEIGGPHNLDARRTPLNSLRFVSRSPAAPGVPLGEPCLSDQYTVREWQHLVAVKNHDELRLHLNGEVAAVSSDRRPLPPRMRLIIGQIFSTKAVRRFIGQLDELAIYEHALSAKQIEDHYSAASGVRGGRHDM